MGGEERKRANEATGGTVRDGTKDGKLFLKLVAENPVTPSHPPYALTQKHINATGSVGIHILNSFGK